MRPGPSVIVGALFSAVWRVLVASDASVGERVFRSVYSVCDREHAHCIFVTAPRSIKCAACEAAAATLAVGERVTQHREDTLSQSAAGPVGGASNAPRPGVVEPHLRMRARTALRMRSAETHWQERSGACARAAAEGSDNRVISFR